MKEVTMKTKKKKQSQKDNPPEDLVEEFVPLLTCEDQSEIFEKRNFVSGISVTEEQVSSTQAPPSEKNYPSLYDSVPTTFGAIVLGILIVGGVQVIVRKIFEREKKDHKALTQFVTSMFALIVGIWIADKLVAGPSTDLLWEKESQDVLTFIKDITLMVFAYYFGVKAQAPNDE
jgi:hypothetical protein